MSAPADPSVSMARDRASELELFQLAARPDPGATVEARLDKVLAGALDWAYVLSAGGLHGVLPLLQAQLGHREDVPPDVRRAMRERCERVTLSNLYLSSRLIEIVDALAGAGIEAIALKGPAVATTLYPSPTLREYGDLDVLVRAADVTRATEVVEDLGFAPWRSVTGGQEDLLPLVEYSRTFTRPADDLDLDLHWDLARSFFRGRVEAAELWEDTRPFDLHGRKILGLGPNMMLFSLCVHGAKHGPFPWPRLKWICDVAGFVRQSEGFDWSEALARAREIGCRRTLLFGLAVARPLLDGRLPSAVEAELAGEGGVENLAGRIWVWLASDEPVTLSFSERAAIDLTLIDDGGGRLSYAVRRILTPTKKDWGSRRLPRHLAFLYVPLRFGRLIRQYVPRPWRLRRLLRTDSPESRREGGS